MCSADADEMVSCGYPGCENELLRSDFDGPQFCSPSHRDGVNETLLDPRHWRSFQRPEPVDDPLRLVWWRVHRDKSYRPTNEAARLISERLSEAEAERNRFEGCLRVVLQNAEAWHGDDEAKGRALGVIAGWAREALRSSP